tara:strand:- start:4680 stop:5330 length:651 start_codon:yes stop_codon:yes gene_type:complete
MFLRYFNLAMVFTLFGLISCDRSEEYVEIKDTREPSRFSPDPELGLSFKDRVGIQQTSNNPSESSKVSFFVKMVGPKSLIDGEKSRFDAFCKTLKVGKGNPPFEWAKPDEWDDVEGTKMRIANFSFGPDKKGECYFTVLPGGGELLSNLNRWRGQMGLPNATRADADALPSRQFLFGEGKYVEIEGSFKGFGVSEGKDGYKMIGIIMPELQIELPK